MQASKEPEKDRTRKHRGARPTALAPVICPFQSGETVLGVDACLAILMQFVRENVEHDLAVALRVDVTVRLLVQELLELRGVDQVAVMRETLQYL